MRCLVGVRPPSVRPPSRPHLLTYSYTTRTTGARRTDSAHFTVVNHLEGDFPGGQVDLYYRFALKDGLIETLTIEP